MKTEGRSDNLNIWLSEQMSPARILLVEDNSQDVELMRQFMQNHHVALTVANSGEDAMETLKRCEPFRLVLMDLRLDCALEGSELFRRIKREYPHTPVVIFSGCVSAPTTDEMRPFGAVIQISKPNEWAQSFFDEIFQALNIPRK